MKRKSNLFFILDIVGDKKNKLIIAFFSGLIATILELFPYILFYKLIVDIKFGYPAQEIYKYILYGLLIVLAYIIFYSISLIFSHNAAFSLLHELRVQTLDHMGNLNLGFFRTKSTGEITRAMDEDIERIEIFIAHQLPDIISSFITPIFILSFVVVINPILAIVLLIPVILSFITMYKIYKGYDNLSSEFNEILIKLHSTIIEYINCINLFKAFNLNARSFEKYMNITTRYRDLWKEINIKFAKLGSIYQLLMDSGLLFAIPMGAWFYFSNKIDSISFIVLLLVCSTFMVNFKKILTVGPSLSRLMIGVDNIRNILEYKPYKELEQYENPNFKGDINFNNISFKYNQKNVLKDISFKIKSGEKVALVGPSGSGKTTIGILLGRFWDLEKGSIEIDNINIKDIEISNLYEHISFVFQSTFILQDTFRENIAMSRNISDEKIIEAAKKAQIHDLIISFENGYDTVLGDNRGIKLSEGEKQRLAIARAIAKGSDIIVLDEITSYSDIQNEEKLQTALHTLLQGKTVIIIAHRLYTIQNVDKIIVLDEGSIIESGSHEDLILKDGMYKKLWKINEVSYGIKD
ncbi:MAG: ABC transporter ATP-binding protein [Tissierellia bacterium]|nr:ABC transporter ATP-binding protein [Tissierellia bacterium]